METYLPLSSNEHNRSKKTPSKSNNLPHHGCTHHVQIHLQTDIKIQEPASSPVLCHAAGLIVTPAGNQCIRLCILAASVFFNAPVNPDSYIRAKRILSKTIKGYRIKLSNAFWDMYKGRRLNNVNEPAHNPTRYV